MTLFSLSSKARFRSDLTANVDCIEFALRDFFSTRLLFAANYGAAFVKHLGARGDDGKQTSVFSLGVES